MKSFKLDKSSSIKYRHQHFIFEAFRVIAARDIPRFNVKKGDIGGWSSSEPYEGDNIWIADNAIVIYHNVPCSILFRGDALIRDTAILIVNSMFRLDTSFDNYFELGGNARIINVLGRLRITLNQPNDKIVIDGNSYIHLNHYNSNLEMRHVINISGKISITSIETMIVFGSSIKITGDVIIQGNCKIRGRVEVNGRVDEGLFLKDFSSVGECIFDCFGILENIDVVSSKVYGSILTRFSKKILEQERNKVVNSDFDGHVELESREGGISILNCNFRESVLIYRGDVNIGGDCPDTLFLRNFELLEIK